MKLQEDAAWGNLSKEEKKEYNVSGGKGVIKGRLQRAVTEHERRAAANCAHR